MAEAIVSVALETLRDLLVQESKFLSGVTDQVKELQLELQRMQCFLRDADAQQYSNESIRNWVQDIKNLAYKAEDIVEEYAVKVGRRRNGGSRMKKILLRLACIVNESIALHKVGSEIEIINKSITNLRNSSETYGIRSFIEGESSNPAAEGKRLAIQTYPFEVDEHFVGMEDDIEALIKLLVNENKESTHGIISLIGMGGSGKTTLAKKIYNHNDMKSCFKAFAWVCITQQCQARSVMRDMLKQLAPQINAETDGEVVRQLHQVQIDKKCLVVIDDIWRVDDWKSLSHCFPKVECNSRVLLTTRQMDVAEIGFPYELKALTETEGWQLLQRVASPQASIEENILADQFESIGKAMVKKCGYLPLAIVVLGGILKGKHRLKDWESIDKDIDSYLMRKGTGKDVVQQVLALSYNDLPYYLKQCFLYFGCFQEDEDIHTNRLYYLWMAEGMILSIHRESKETMRDVSERYLEELARRCVVQVEKNVESNQGGQFKSCRLHDLMHDYCVRKCKEENFLDVMDKGGVVNDPDHAFKNSCRLTMNDNFGASCSIPSEQISIGLRSLQIVGRFLYDDLYDDGNENIPPAIWSVKRFHLLRTLVINGYDFGGKSLDGMEKLIHLRYLGLTQCISVTFPSSIVKLSYLKILDLTGSFLTLYPIEIHRLGGIRYLYLPFFFDIPNRPNRKFSFDYLQQLEILIGVSSAYHDFTDLSALKNLRIFNVTVGPYGDSKTFLVQICNYLNTAGTNLTYCKVRVRNVYDLDSVLMKQILTCHNLHVLIFDGCRVRGWPDNVHCPQLSSSIEQLNLYHSLVFNDLMPILKKLPNLKVLAFYDSMFCMEESSCDAGGFPQLVKLEEISCDAGGFPQLVKLELFTVGDIPFFPVPVLPSTGREFHLRIDEGAMPNLGSLRVRKYTVLTIPDKLKCIVTNERGRDF